MKNTLIITFISLICTCGLFAQQNYELIWSDEFDEPGAVDLSKWSFEIGGGGWGNQEVQYYTNRTQNAKVENGMLVINVLKEQYENRNYTSARIISKGKGVTLYGKIEAKISLPKGSGTWPAFWMMPEVNTYGTWPRSGEIDIMEHVGYDPSWISCAVHTKDRSAGNAWSKKVYPEINVEGEFHIYGIEWFEDRIEFYFDDVKQVTLWKNSTATTDQWPFNHSFYVILNVALGGTMGKTVDDNIFKSPVQMKVDYVRIYRAKVSSLTDTKQNSTKVCPNPVETTLNVETILPSRLILTDSFGRKYWDFEATAYREEVDVQSLSSGLYLLSIMQPNFMETYKIFKK